MTPNQFNGVNAQPAYIIDTTDDRRAIEQVQRALGHEPIEIIGLGQLRGANEWQTLSRARMVLTKWSGDAGEPFLAPSRVASVHLLPALAIGSRAPGAVGLEALRRSGASAFLDEDLDDQIAAQELLRSTHWFTSPLDRVPVPDTVQVLSADDRSGVLVLACPHCRPLSLLSWQETAGQCQGDGKCTGAVARIYVVGGRPVHAETSHLQGVEAFAQCLEFKTGVARFCEVFLPPQEHTLDGTASQLLIHAAALADESQRDMKLDEASERRGPPNLPQRSRKTKAMSKARSHHEQLSQATLVVQANVDGGVSSVSGEGDGEGLAAVASIASRAFEQAVGQLGFGTLEGWTVCGDNANCVVAKDNDELAVAFTPKPKDAFRHLDALLRATKKGGSR